MLSFYFPALFFPALQISLNKIDVLHFPYYKPY
jgi:hypothetical protein